MEEEAKVKANDLKPRIAVVHIRLYAAMKKMKYDTRHDIDQC